MQCYKNGQLIDSIPLLDRAFHYGDGCFTTARIFQDTFELKQLHFARLALACQRLSLDVDLSVIDRSLAQLQQQLNKHLLRISQLTRVLTRKTVIKVTITITSITQRVGLCCWG